MLPYLTEVRRPSKKQNIIFRGINYGENKQDGEFSETYNLSTDKYPCITQRAVRAIAGKYESPSTIHAKGSLLVIDGTKVFYGDEEVGTVTEGKKQTATVGNYIVIFPDKVYYKVPTVDENGESVAGEFGDMEGAYTGEVDFTENTITAKSGTFKLKKGDGVIIENCSTNANNKEKAVLIKDKTDTVLTFDDGSFTKTTGEKNVTIKRVVPELEFICESNYRLWGVKDNTIYSSKYSDPMNFSVFEGLASDSYSIEVGSEGKFTGCMAYSSHICFFKENTLHKLYGTKPSNFQINTSNVYGVQSGSEGSMQIVNEQLLYKGVDGVYAYTGGIPELISEKLGNNRYSDAVACCDGEKYYISMRKGDEWSFFSFDVMKNIWLREDNTLAVDMAFYDGKVYFIDDCGWLYFIDKTADRAGIEWGATFCTMHETMDERKGYSKFHLRMDMDAGAYLAVDIKTDNDEKWKQIYTTHNEKAKTVSIPIVPTRCDSLDIRLRGKGNCTIKSFSREFTVGSDV